MDTAEYLPIMLDYRHNWLLGITIGIFVWMIPHSENGEISLGGGLFKAKRCFGFKPTVVPTSR